MIAKFPDSKRRKREKVAVDSRPWFMQKKIKNEAERKNFANNRTIFPRFFSSHHPIFASHSPQERRLMISYSHLNSICSRSEISMGEAQKSGREFVPPSGILEQFFLLSNLHDFWKVSERQNGGERLWVVSGRIVMAFRTDKLDHHLAESWKVSLFDLRLCSNVDCDKTDKCFLPQNLFRFSTFPHYNHHQLSNQPPLPSAIFSFLHSRVLLLRETHNVERDWSATQLGYSTNNGMII